MIVNFLTTLSLMRIYASKMEEKQLYALTNYPYYNIIANN